MAGEAAGGFASTFSKSERQRPLAPRGWLNDECTLSANRVLVLSCVSFRFRTASVGLAPAERQLLATRRERRLLFRTRLCSPGFARRTESGAEIRRGLITVANQLPSRPGQARRKCSVAGRRDPRAYPDEKKDYGFKSYETIEIARYLHLRRIPESETTHRFC